MILTSGVLLSQDRFDFKVRNYFFAGLAGDSAALQKGMKICEDILAKDPKQPEALVWHGTGLISESREAFQRGDQQSGAKLWQRGMDEMDLAEALAPEDLGVRIVRGAVLLIASQHLPDPDEARPLIEKGLSDYEKAYSVQGPDLKRPWHAQSRRIDDRPRRRLCAAGSAGQSAEVVRAYTKGTARDPLREIRHDVVADQESRAAPGRMPELPCGRVQVEQVR